MFDPLTSERLKWFGPAWLGTLGSFWLIEEQLKIEPGWNLFGVNLVVSFLAVLLVFWLLYFHSKRYAAFLKLADKNTISLVVSAYKDPRPPTSARYYKEMANGQKHNLIGAHGYLTGIDTAKVLASFVTKLREIGSYDIEVVKDGDQLLKAGPVICFGSPSSNFTSEQFLPGGVDFKGPNILDVKLAHSNSTYTSDPESDYGIVAREVRPNEDKSQSWGFVCAGIDEEGTIAASVYLLREWKTLKRYQGAFLHCVSCKKRSPEKPQKLSGFSKDANGEWKPD
jgi:hypothetical protein